MINMPAVLMHVQNIDKSFTNEGTTKKVLSDISFVLSQSDSIALIGASGCGKSTLLNILSGIESADSGTVHIAEDNIQIGYIQQHDSLLPWRTVLENCVLPLQLHRHLNKDARQKRGYALLQRLQLEECAQLHPYQISGGMRQKVSLARAIIEDPHLLLLDEPFRSLDGITKIEVYRWYNEMRQQGALTTVLVTHDIHEAATLAQTVLVCSQRPMRITQTINAPSVRNKKNAIVYEQKIYDAVHNTQ